jgi:putative aminopeptidase FrvX
MEPLAVDPDYLIDILRRLINTPSPTGMTDMATRLVSNELETLGIDYELTQRGAIRATLVLDS